MHKKACPMNVVLREFNEKARMAPLERPARGVCTGCHSKFNEDNPCEDDCKDCGYQTCESCSVHKTRGAWSPERVAAYTDPWPMTSLRHLLLPQFKLRNTILLLESSLVA